MKLSTPWPGPGMLLGLALGLVLGLSLRAPAVAGAPGAHDTWTRVRDDILTRYPRPPDADALAYSSIRGMIGSLDRWTRFYAPDEVAAATLDPPDIGIGATTSPGACGLWVTAVEGSSATAGLHAGDCIVTVDGHTLAAVAEADRAAMLSGPSRSASVLSVIRAQGGPDAGKTALIAVRRDWRNGAPLEMQDVQIVGGPRVTVARVHSFPVGVTELLGRPAQPRMIVDLRGNPGGEMSEGVRFIDRFATEGVLLDSEVRGEAARTWTAENDGDEITARVVVFVDEGTASAAEIVAAGLRARIGAVVVGRPTVGKRTIQTVLHYEDGSAMQLTIGHFKVAGGDLPIDVGVPPDANLPAGVEDPAWMNAAAAVFNR